MVIFMAHERQTLDGVRHPYNSDLEHVLRNIVEGLDDELKWPNEQRRQELANVYPGIFNGCIGVGDVKEYQVVKYKDPVKERHSWCGKKK